MESDAGRAVSRRAALRLAAAGATGAAVGVAGSAAVFGYATDHPSPTDRVSPLLADAALPGQTTVLWRGATTARVAALTFDDGPDVRWTPVVLDLLRRTGAVATFFMLGQFVVEHPEVARAVADAGHEVGSHSWDHRHLVSQSAAALTDALTRTHETIRSATGRVPRVMRPPYGQLDAETTAAIARCGYAIALWSHRMTADDPQARLEDTVRTAHPGMIILSHDGRGTPTTAQMSAVEALVTSMQADGWSFVTVSSLLDAAGA